MAEIKIELTNEEQLKYDLTYKSIISNYTKKELKIIEDDPIAMFYLKNIVLKYVLTGDFPTVNQIQSNIHLLPENELIENYNAKIPLQEKPNNNLVIEKDDSLISNIKEELHNE